MNSPSLNEAIKSREAFGPGFPNHNNLTTKLRTLLILGRISNLPTVWSNCLAGWLLGGGGHLQNLWLLLVGATFSYVGGMFLNDAFDAEFDRQYRSERPIPMGWISLAHVWRWGLLWLGLGGVCFIGINVLTGSLGIFLFVLILLYDALHKRIAWGPVLMGLCRLFLYLIAASAGGHVITGESVWCGIALAAYIMGVSFVARGEAIAGPLRYWPALLMAAPIFLAMLMNAGDYREAALMLSAVLGLLILRALRHTFWASPPRIGFTVSQLLAGIVFVDWLAVAYAPRAIGFLFIGLFLGALALQRVVPAT